MFMNAGAEKRELSLSIEPLLLPAPYEQPLEQQEEGGAAGNGWKCPFRKHGDNCGGGINKRAAFLFLRILIALLLFTVLAQFCIRFVLPFASSYLASRSLSYSARFVPAETPGMIEKNEEESIPQLFEKELPELVHEFEVFESQFERLWHNEQHRWERYNIFKKNFYEIQRLNAEAKVAGKNVSYGVNGMADWSEEEMQKMLLPLDYFKKRRQEATFIRKMNPILRRAFTAKSAEQDANEYPGHFDWRDRGVVTPVKAQGQCGSCWAFAAVATTESANAVAHGRLSSLSEQELLDCNLENNACNGGNEDKAFRFIHEFGLVGEQEYPYVAHRQNVCRVDEQMNRTKIDVAVFINPDEQSMLDWLLNFGPVNVGIAVPPDMKPYKGGIYHPSDYDCKFRVMGLHALLVVGYGVSDDGEKYWIVKNSWGNTWGQEHGYVNFIRGINACGIEDEPIGLLA